MTLSEFASLCYELGVELQFLQFRWVANFGMKSQLSESCLAPSLRCGVNIYLPVEQLIRTINLRTKTSCETMSCFRHALC